MIVSVESCSDIGWIQRAGLNCSASVPQVDLLVCKAMTLTFTALGARREEDDADGVPSGIVCSDLLPRMSRVTGGKRRRVSSYVLSISVRNTSATAA